jgi:hypothetical protein
MNFRALIKGNFAQHFVDAANVEGRAALCRQKRRHLAYYRVGTDRRGRSGPGHESQRETVRRYVESVWRHATCRYVLLASLRSQLNDMYA